MQTMTTVSTIPTTEITIDAQPSLRPPSGSRTAVLLATTALQTTEHELYWYSTVHCSIPSSRMWEHVGPLETLPCPT